MVERWYLSGGVVVEWRWSGGGVVEDEVRDGLRQGHTVCAR